MIWILGGWILGEIVAGWFGISFAGHTSLDTVMEEQKLLSSARITGTVVYVEETGYGVQAVLTDNQVLWNEQVLETHDVILREDSKKGSSRLLSFDPGSRILVTGDIHPFSVPGNPGEFNQRDYYRAKGIDYRVSVETCQFVEGRSCLLAQMLEQVRKQVMSGIRRVADSEKEYGLYLAVLLGDKSAMDDETETLYQNGGISHLLAISGLHLSFLGMGIWKILRRCYLPQVPAGLVSSVLLLAYVQMIGGSASSWRAWIMFTVMLIAGMIGRTYDLLSALGLAGILLLIDQPLYAWQAGFQLSFGAMAGIGMIDPILTAWCETRNGTFSKIRRALLSGISIQLATLPVIAYHFFQVPVYGIFLNLAAIPLMSYALVSAMTGSLLGLIWVEGGVFVSGTAHYIFQLFHEICCLAERLPGAVQVTGRPENLQIVVYYVLLGGMLVWMKRQRKEKRMRTEKGKMGLWWNGIFQKRGEGLRKFKIRTIWTCLGIYVGFLLLLFPGRQEGLSVTMLDVGQGDGMVLQLPDGSACLVDGGSTGVTDVGEKRILPYLKCEGIREISMIFLTHEDKDHINGICRILEDTAVKVGGIAIPAVIYDMAAWEEVLSLAFDQNIPVYRLAAGDVWSCAGVDLHVLHPSAEFSPPNANSTSLVLRLEYQDFSMLFMGDLESEQEMTLLESFSDVDILKVGHHGSGGATCDSFLQVTRPEIALISCGRNNLYGHPHEDTLERLAVAESITLTTPEYGAITVEYDGEVRVTSWLQPGNHRTGK